MTIPSSFEQTAPTALVAAEDYLTEHLADVPGRRYVHGLDPAEQDPRTGILDGPGE